MCVGGGGGGGGGDNILVHVLSSTEVECHQSVSRSMGRSETIRDFMKRFEATLFQLDVMSPNTALQAIRPNTKFCDSLSLHPRIQSMNYSRGVTNTPCSRTTLS